MKLIKKRIKFVDIHKKLFDLGMNVFYGRLAALKSQFDNNDEKFIIDQFGKFLDMSKAYISSSDQLIAITKKLNFY